MGLALSEREVGTYEQGSAHHSGDSVGFPSGFAPQLLTSRAF
jgi:hypothetical protein